MLSRVAERIYWLGRYLERAENTARMASVYHNFLLDLPMSMQLGWDMLLEVVGCEDSFKKRYRIANERNVIRFLLASERNSSSIYSSVHAARENVRTTREILPSETWEAINGLYLFVRENASESVARSRRQIFVDGIVTRSQRISGLLIDNMSHDEAHEFLHLGRYIERADMITRIVDTGSLVFENMGNARELPAVQSTFWIAVLQALSAYQMYRQSVRLRVNRKDTLSYVFLDERFPRTVRFCLMEVAMSLSQLPRSDMASKQVSRLMRHLRRQHFDELRDKELHEFIDGLQIELNKIHEHIIDTWFEVSDH